MGCQLVELSVKDHFAHLSILCILALFMLSPLSEQAREDYSSQKLVLTK